MTDLRFVIHRLADVSEALDEVQQQYVGLRAADHHGQPKLLKLLEVSIPELEAEAMRLHALLVESERQQATPPPPDEH